MDALLWLGLGVVLTLVADWGLMFWRNAENSRRRHEAEKLLAAHGMSAHLYLATIGIKDRELRSALDRFAFTGHIVLDPHGNVVGKLVPKIAKGPHLRLVVNNTV